MTKIRTTAYTHRYIARIIIEATTPISVGAGNKDIFTDSIVLLDINNLPYIPGSSLAGVFRSLSTEEEEMFFGDQQEASKIVFSEAKILNSASDVIDGLQPNITDGLLSLYTNLPIRQHVRISDKGVAENAGKYDQQVVYAGTRFCFEVEMMAEDDNHYTDFKHILQKMYHIDFMLGGGTRKGLGQINVIDIKTRDFNLKESSDRDSYLTRSSNLSLSNSVNFEGLTAEKNNGNWVKYNLRVKPLNFFSFGSGFGDDDVDMTPVKESKIKWNENKASVEHDLILIPATSIKGAISHRVAFHYNRLTNATAESGNGKTGNENPAVCALFGYEDQKNKIQKKGNVIISDMIIERKMKEKIQQHVSISSFTGGGLDSALFQEKLVYGGEQILNFDINVKENALADEKIKEALECTLDDIKKGLLPLGGSVNRGNGMFIEA